MVEFVPMSRAEYESWYETSVTNYAEENIVSGKWTKQEAVSRSTQEFGSILPNGQATPENYICSIVDEGQSERVGMIWYAVRRDGEKRFAFIYDFIIEKAHRRKGYGTEALLLLEDKVRALELSSVALHVFAHNKAARNVYAKSGYHEVDIVMSKEISRE
jgi:RimJ/RimL family protein N-acetyltransferase